MPVFSLTANLFQQIDRFDTGAPILLVKVAPFPRWDDRSWPAGCTLCLPFQDPTNVGAVIRSAAAFGVSRVLLLEEAAHPFHPKSVRAAGSTLFRIPIRQGPSIHDLRVHNIPMVTLSPEGQDLDHYGFPPKFCLVPGLEGPGLPESLRATSLAVPMSAGVDSLNAAVATGIVLYRWRCGLADRPHASGNRTGRMPYKLRQ
jgi:tRNA G18 (ribose-2'-O)-methylase SpoU